MREGGRQVTSSCGVTVSTEDFKSFRQSSTLCRSFIFLIINHLFRIKIKKPLVIQLLMPASERSVTDLQAQISVVFGAFCRVGLLLRECCQGKSSRAYRRWLVVLEKWRLLLCRSGTQFSGVRIRTQGLQICEAGSNHREVSHSMRQNPAVS